LLRLATELEMPPVTVTAAPHHGELPRTGSLASLAPESFRLLAIKPAQDGNGWIVRVQETAGKCGRPVLEWLGSKVKLDAVEARRIASWRLLKKCGRWQAKRVSAQG
jgi:alpha-mannosidase